jgi:putative tryptophan/tyrosine transport system substrate-binding protein
MKRKQFAFLVTGIVCVMLAPLTTLAQQPSKIARVGWMSIATPAAPALNYDVFRQAMRDLGYVEGKNLVLEPRYTGGKNELLPELIADLERVGVDVIVAGPFGVLRVAKQTTRIPIVMTPSADPVVAGIIQSLAQPGRKRYRHYGDGSAANSKTAGNAESDCADAKPGRDLMATRHVE